MILSIVEEAKASNLLGQEVDYFNGFDEVPLFTVTGVLSWVHFALFTVLYHWKLAYGRESLELFRWAGYSAQFDSEMSATLWLPVDPISV